MTPVTLANGPGMTSEVAPLASNASGAFAPVDPQWIQTLLQSPAMQALMMSMTQSMQMSPAMGYGFGASPFDPMGMLMGGGMDPMSLMGGMPGFGGMGGMGGMYGISPMDPRMQQLQQMNMFTQAFGAMGDDGGDDE